MNDVLLLKYIKEAKKIKNKEDRNYFLISKNICPIDLKFSLETDKNTFEKYCNICGQIFEQDIEQQQTREKSDDEIISKNISSEISKLYSTRQNKLKTTTKSYMLFTTNKKTLEAYIYMKEILNMMYADEVIIKNKKYILEDALIYFNRYKKHYENKILLVAILALKNALEDNLYFISNKKLIKYISNYHRYKIYEHKLTKKPKVFKEKNYLAKLVEIEMEINKDKYNSAKYNAQNAIHYFKIPYTNKNLSELEELYKFIRKEKINIPFIKIIRNIIRNKRVDNVQNFINKNNIYSLKFKNPNSKKQNLKKQYK
jgi:hypothetical protein